VIARRDKGRWTSTRVGPVGSHTIPALHRGWEMDSRMGVRRPSASQPLIRSTVTVSQCSDSLDSTCLVLVLLTFTSAGSMPVTVATMTSFNGGRTFGRACPCHPEASPSALSSPRADGTGAWPRGCSLAPDLIDAPGTAAPNLLEESLPGLCQGKPGKADGHGSTALTCQEAPSTAASAMPTDG
jgi:hypothetical protein